MYSTINPCNFPTASYSSPVNYVRTERFGQAWGATCFSCSSALFHWRRLDPRLSQSLREDLICSATFGFFYIHHLEYSVEVFTWISLADNWPFHPKRKWVKVLTLIILFANVYFASVFFCLSVSVLLCYLCSPEKGLGTTVCKNSIVSIELMSKWYSLFPFKCL